jgi:hypothetical protein
VLPITLIQDHTLAEILRRESVDSWVEKARWIAGHHGLVNLILHPDYVLREDRLALYDEFLGRLRKLDGGWFALPRAVAASWPARAADGLDAPCAGRGRATEVAGEIVLEPVP